MKYEVCVLPRERLKQKWERKGTGQRTKLWGTFLVLPRRWGGADRWWWVGTWEEWKGRWRGATKEVAMPSQSSCSLRSSYLLKPFFSPSWESDTDRPCQMSQSEGETQHGAWVVGILSRATALLSAFSQWKLVSDWHGTFSWVSFFPISLEGSAWHVVCAQWGAGFMEMLTSSSVSLRKPNKTDPEKKLEMWWKLLFTFCGLCLRQLVASYAQHGGRALYPNIWNLKCSKIQNFHSAYLTPQVENSIPRNFIFSTELFEAVYKITSILCV